MSEKDDGGCAFPRDDYQTDGGPGQRGMSLRDWFAGQALTAVIADTSGVYSDATHFIKIVAGRSYEIADAMLLARSHREEKQ